MKKNYYSLFAAATMLLAASSCSQEEAIPQPSSELVSFEISLEGVAESRTAGDGLTANKLYYEVYQGTGDERTKVLDNYYGDDNDDTTIDNVLTLNGGKTEVKLPLLRGENYDIMFWAQADGSIYNPTDLEKISVTYDEYTTANNEKYDAFFYGKPGFKATNDVTKIELRRPFAQLNIGTHEDDWAQALEVIGGADAPVTQSTVTVTNLATSFNVLSGVATAPEEPNTVTFKLADINKETFEAKDADYYNLAMNYLLVPGTPDKEGNVKSTTDVTATFYRGATNLFTIGELPTVAIQRNWRTNILGNLLADDKTFTIEVVPGFSNDHNIDYSTVDSDEDLEAALRQTDDEIVIDLASSSRAGKTYTVNIGSTQEKYRFGGANTKTITINANGNTICFNHNDGDWNYIRCVNENAKWIINNAHLTNSDNNDGPWNRHDIRFYNAVELNDVTSDKAIALLNNGKLENVSITEDIEAYGLWITAQGQTVDINNLEITATNAGRGIKIADQYVDEPKSVTLNVANSKFTTAKKAAILVTSTAGAAIKLENIDLSGVAADKFNAVWVDEDRAENADKVTVTGGFKKVESAEDTAETNPFLTENATVKVAKGIYGTLPKMADGVTIEAEEGTVFTGTSGIAGKNVTIKNVRFVNEETSKALSGSLTGTTFENCTFESKEGARYCYAYGDVIFNNCTFGDENCIRGVHFDAGDGTITFNNCKLYGFQALGHSIKKITFNDCEFLYNNNYNVVNMYSVFEYNNCSFNPSMFTDCADNNVTAAYNNCSYTDGKSIYSIVRFDKDPATCTITFDNASLNFVKNAAGLTAALADENISNIILTADITCEGTFNITRNVTINSADANKKATIKGRLHIASTNATITNVIFDRNDTDSNKDWDKTFGSPTKWQGYLAVVMTYGNNSHKIKFEKCDFMNSYGNDYSAINNVACDLIVDNCYFNGKGSAFYSSTNLTITNSTFDFDNGTNPNVAVSLNGLGDTGGKFIFTGNKAINKNINLVSQFLSTTGYGNGTYYFNVQDNEGFVNYFANESRVTNKEFAEGSVTF